MRTTADFGVVGVLRVGGEPYDYRPPRSRWSDLPRGRSEASEDFGVRMEPEGVPQGILRLYWFPAAFIIGGCVAFVAFLVTPAHPMDPALLEAGLVYEGFFLAFVGWVVLWAIDALLTRMRRKEEGRREYVRLIIRAREYVPRQGP